MSQSNPSPTIDGLFRRLLTRQPDEVALVDPTDKMRITGTPAMQLTYAQADRAIDALAAHFTTANLPANSVIAVQLPNTVEFMLTVLAAHRVGLIVALLPQLWRQADLTKALNRTGARAIVSFSHIDGVNHADLIMNAAAESFSIRHVCGFGPNLPEGMASLDEAITSDFTSPIPAIQDSRRVAAISFDQTSDGYRAVPRTHLNLISGGLSVFLEAGFPLNARIISTQAPTTYGGLAASLVSWLLSSGTLVLHHPFDDTVMQRQIVSTRCDVLIAPAALIERMAEAKSFAALPTIAHVIALWRNPDQIATSATWETPNTTLTDIYLFGEVGLISARRDESGAPHAIMTGTYAAPNSSTSTSSACELLITPKGTLGLRGPMIPLLAYTTHIDNRYRPEETVDYVDTGYAVRLDRTNGAICITAPPSGLVSVGGYRFVADELNEWAKRLGPSAMLTAVPDRVNGYRLAGRASNNARARDALTELGLNPLMIEAFRERTGAE